MAHLNGIFSDPSPGRLIVTLAGDFLAGTRRDVGFPSSGTTDMFVRASINGIKSPSISREAPTVMFEIAGYPGGNVQWVCATEELAYASGGILSGYGFQNLSMHVRLEKK